MIYFPQRFNISGISTLALIPPSFTLSVSFFHLLYWKAILLYGCSSISQPKSNPQKAKDKITKTAVSFYRPYCSGAKYSLQSRVQNIVSFKSTKRLKNFWSACVMSSLELFGDLGPANHFQDSAPVWWGILQIQCKDLELTVCLTFLLLGAENEFVWKQVLSLFITYFFV